jgi:hypothetical protein
MRATIEVIRMVAYALDDGVDGVNAQFAAMTFDGLDEQPPDVTAVLNEADHDTEIHEKPASGWPVLLVEEEERGTTADPEAVVGWRDGFVYVVISKAVESTSSLEWRRSKFTNEAIVRSLDRGLLAPDKIQTKGLRNGIQLLQAAQQITSPRVERQLGIGVHINPIVYAFNYRDNSP